MVNEAMVRTGWAESETYKPDTKYKDVLDAAEQFSVQKVLGVRFLCGKFGQPPDGPPRSSDQQIADAWRRQPNQEQLPPFPGSEPTTVPQPNEPAPAPTEAPYVPPTEVPWVPPTEVPAQQPSGDCDPSYPDVCIAPA
jgi:hypothetical protein